MKRDRQIMLTQKASTTFMNITNKLLVAIDRLTKELSFRSVFYLQSKKTIYGFLKS